MSLESDLYELFQPLTGGTLVFMDQNAPRPALPFTAMKVMSRRMVNRDHYDDPDSLGNQNVDGDREFTLNLQRYQAFGPDSVTQTLETVAEKIRLNSVIDKFLAKGLIAFDSSAVNDISALLDKSQIEKRATLDIFLRYKSRQVDNVGIIDTASVQSTGTNEPGKNSSGDWTVVVTSIP